MSNFNYEKKLEHEKAAEKALMEDDFPSAFYHVAEAAKFALALANQCTGKLREAYMSNANELMDLAEKCKEDWKKNYGGRGKRIRSISVYLKHEDEKAYYLVNGSEDGSIGI